MVGGTAVALAVAVATWWQKRKTSQRAQWRNDDRAQGWMDDGGNWHTGAIDLVMGYTDRDGNYHDGLNRRVLTLEAKAHDHGTTPTPTRRRQ